MSNLIPLEDAARMLGLTVDKLNDMRSNSEIFGYKDGTSWKFKMQELERVADEMDITLNLGAAADEAADEVIDLVDDEIEFDLGDSSEDLMDDDVVEVTDDDDEIQLLDDDDDGEIQLIEDEDEAIEIVEEDDKAGSDQGVLNFDDEDDIQLVDDDDDELELFDDESASDDADPEPVAADADDELEIVMEDDDDELKLEDESGEIEVAGEDDLSFGSSDIRLAGEDEEPKAEASDEFLLEDDDLVLEDDSSVELQTDDGGQDATMAGASESLDDLDDGADMLLSEDDLFDDDLQIQESHEDDIELSSDFEESEDLIMDDSDSSELVGSQDSGLILEEDSGDIDLSGSLMDLAGDDNDEMIVLDDPAPADAATDIADDDFNLTPLEELGDEESSGSQVIALEDSDMFSDETAATLLQPSDEMAAEPMLTEDAMDVGDFGGFDAGVPGMTPGMVTPGTTGGLPEQPYTWGQVASLSTVTLLLGAGAMVGYDLARNLWLPEDQIVTSGMLKMILSLVGG